MQSTSATLAGSPDAAGFAGQLAIEALPREAAVVDLVYKPRETAVLARAKERGLKTVDGMGMLLHQAVPAFEGFYGVRPHVSNELRRAVEATL